MRSPEGLEAMKEPRQLDRSRSFGIVYGGADHRFEQDGLCFDAHGMEILSEEATTQIRGQPEVERACVHPTAAASRMRRSRARRRAGVVAVVHLEVTERDVAA